MFVKKQKVIVVMILFLLLALSGCFDNEKSKFVGTWKSGNYVFHFDGDGFIYYDSMQIGDWSIDDGRIKMDMGGFKLGMYGVVEGVVIYEYEFIDSDTLVLETLSGSNKFTLKRQYDSDEQIIVEDEDEIEEDDSEDDVEDIVYEWYGENFTFTLLDGTTAEIKDYKGKIIILDMWAIRCPPCQHQMLELAKAYNTYSRDDLEILSINIDLGETNANIKDFINQFEQDLDWVFGNEIDTLPTHGYIPSMCIFDRNGNIVYEHVGVISFDEELKDKIDVFIKR